MAGSNSNIFCPGSLYLPHPLLCTELRRVKAACKAGILLVRELLPEHDPLSASHHGVDAPMYEHPEFIVAELFFGGKGFGRRRITLNTFFDI